MMKTLNKVLTSLALLAIFGGNLAAQNLTERVAESKDIAAGVYHPYHYGDLTDTPAPKGYKPFYISHYGRHGSRYHTSDRFFKSGEKYLKLAKEAGILSEQGENLYREFMIVVKEHTGMEGQLSPLGAREHRGIAERMYERFPEVFKNDDRLEVDCVSSIVPRCLISMANFTTELKDENPELEFSFVTGQKYYEYIAKNLDSKELFKLTGEYENAKRMAICHYDKFFETIFTDKEQAEKLVDGQSLLRSVFLTGSICGDLDYLGIDLFKYIASEELAEQCIVRSNKFYGEFGNSQEGGDVSCEAAKGLLKDFINKADAALSDDSERSADLRFGHDTGLLPFLGLIGVEGMDVRYPMDEADSHGWTTYDKIPMGSNFQMIFYRSKKNNDVLVKMLRNEEETLIPALKPFSGPYYKWSELREYLVAKTK